MSVSLLNKCNSIIHVGDACFGEGQFSLIAGPCAIETPRQMHHIGRVLKENNISVMRGGLYKPRSAPQAFQGLGAAGIDLIKEIKETYNLSFITEAVDKDSLNVIFEVADVIQIGARNAQNYELLKVAGACGKPVMLKRGFAMTYAEWISSAEYLVYHGCHDIILCERGMRTATEVTRFSLDVGAISYAQTDVPVPIFADPSHPAGARNLVLPLSYSAVGAGADGLIVEISDCPDDALCDGMQGITSEELGTLKRTSETIYQSIHA